MPGPGKKPASLKAIAGTERADRATPDGVRLPPLSEAPAPPDWLPNVHAVGEWNRLAPLLVANGLLTEGGLSALGNLCALHGKMVQLWAAGESPTANMIGQYRGWVNDFGLTPVAQGKVKPVTDKSESNPFARNGQRAA